MKKLIKRFIYKNELVYRLIRRNANRFLIRPYIRWRDVPIIAITGTNGKTTVTRLLNHIYLSAGYRVGMACSEGVYQDGIEIIHGDYTGGLGVWHAAWGRAIDILVAETGRGGIIRYGLGYSNCRISVVTNIYEDHLGLDGIHTLEEMAEVKSTIARHTEASGLVVLNGDNSLVRRMASKTHASVIYFTVEKRHDEFKDCYYLHNDKVYRKSGSLTDCVLDVKNFPITLKGQLTYNVANVIAAFAAVEGMQPWVPVSLETARSALATFGKDPNDNPTRLFTMLNYKGKTILLCRCKNPASIQRDLEVIKRIQKKHNFKHLIGILTGIGDRRRDHFEKISCMVAPICRYFFIRPPAKKYWRGRKGEEIVSLLSVSIPKDRILSTKNLPIESVFDQTQQVLIENCLYVFFSALWEADLDISGLLSNGRIVPLQINE